MTGRENVIRGLKGLNKQISWGAENAPAAYVKSIWNENDRGVIILNGSAMESQLEARIREQMPHLNGEERAYLFDFNGPIGTFSSKIRIANALGIINRQFFKKIDLVREMRNTCAHTVNPISFLTKEIYDATVCLVHDLRIELPDADDNDSVRKTFMLGCIFGMMYVQVGSADDAHKAVVEVLRRNKKASPEEPAK